MLVTGGCGSSRITTAWKAEHSAPIKYNRILVVGVFKGNDDSLRSQVEQYFVKSLTELGYLSLSAVAEFGPEGLANLGEVETYKKICNDGIDAVLTVALIDGNKEPRQKYRKVYGYPSNYYYQRIWNYKNIMAMQAANGNGEGRFFWETILFNLNTLEAECTIQTRSFKELKLAKTSREFEGQVIQKMIKEKILTRQDDNKTALPKAF